MTDAKVQKEFVRDSGDATKAAATKAAATKGTAAKGAAAKGAAAKGAAAKGTAKVAKKTGEKKATTAKTTGTTKAGKGSSRKVQKTIGGAKNGGTRTVIKKRTPRFYPTEDTRRGRSTRSGQKQQKRRGKVTNHSRKLRASITPGTVLILLAGAHKSKRVVFLKQLASGLLLVTGPYKVNGCPLRRVNQRYVIATKTKIPLDQVTIPKTLNDAYFKRVTKKTPKDAGLFDQKEESYKPSDKKVQDQVDIDKALLKAMKSSDKMLRGYLSTPFQLKKKQFPHQMVF